MVCSKQAHDRVEENVGNFGLSQNNRIFNKRTMSVSACEARGGGYPMGFGVKAYNLEYLTQTVKCLDSISII